jgi:hypothetical protein
MFLVRTKQFLGLGLVALALVGCGGPGAEEFDKLAKQNKLNKSERLALEGCYKAMGGKKPIVTIGTEVKMMSDVPLEVCVCQSRAMAAVFQDGQYGSYDGFTRWYGRLEKKTFPRLSRKDTKIGIDRTAASKRLVKSFESCANQFATQIKDNEEYKNFWEAPPAPKKKKGEGDEKKTASNG